MLDDVRARTLRVERTPGIPISPHARRGENGLPDRFLGPGVANARRHAPKGQRGGGRMKHYEAAEARNQFRTNMSVGMERARYDELLNQAREKFPHATAHAPTRPALANKRVGGNQDSAAAGIPSPHALHRKIYRPKTFTNDDHYLMHLENVAMVHSPSRRHSRRRDWEPPEDLLSASSGTTASTLALLLTLRRTCTGSTVERRTGGKSILLCSCACHASFDMTATERRYEHGPQRRQRRRPLTQHLRRERNGGPLDLGRNCCRVGGNRPDAAHRVEGAASPIRRKPLSLLGRVRVRGLVENSFHRET